MNCRDQTQDIVQVYKNIRPWIKRFTHLTRNISNAQDNESCDSSSIRNAIKD